MDEIEERAVKSVRAGQPDVEAIYLAYRDAMLSTAEKKLLGGDALGLGAEDIVDDVVSGMLDGTIQLPPATAHHLRPFLRRIVANKATDLIRRRTADTAAVQRQHPTDLTNVEEDVETMVIVEQLEERMYLLTEKEHYVIIENVKNQRPPKDVASELGCAPQYISQLRKSALRKLAAELPFMDEP